MTQQWRGARSLRPVSPRTGTCEDAEQPDGTELSQQPRRPLVPSPLFLPHSPGVHGVMMVSPSSTRDRRLLRASSLQSLFLSLHSALLRPRPFICVHPCSSVVIPIFDCRLPRACLAGPPCIQCPVSGVLCSWRPLAPWRFARPAPVSGIRCPVFRVLGAMAILPAQFIPPLRPSVFVCVYQWLMLLSSCRRRERRQDRPSAQDSPGHSTGYLVLLPARASDLDSYRGSPDHRRRHRSDHGRSRGRSRGPDRSGRDHWSDAESVGDKHLGSDPWVRP